MPLPPSAAPIAAWPVAAPAGLEARDRGGVLAGVAGVLALVGGVLSVGGTLLPVTVWGDDSQPPFSILPVFGGPISNAFNEFTWFALEPIGIAIAAGLLGTSLLVVQRPRRAGGGALAAFGLTTLFAFGAYVMSSVFTEKLGTPYGPAPGPGSWLGIASGVALLVAGTLALVAGSRRTG